MKPKINLIYPDDSYDLSQFNISGSETFCRFDPQWNWTFEWLLNCCNIQYKKSTTVDKSCNNFLAISLISLNAENLYNLPLEYIKKLENDNTWLLFYQGIEANCYYWHPGWDDFYDFLKNKDIPPEKIYFVTGDLRAEQNHKKYDHEYFSKINVCSINLFEMVHMSFIKEKERFFHESINLYQSTKKTNDFLNFNALIRPNKQMLLFYLFKNEFFENNLISCLWRDDYEKRIADKDTFQEFNFDNSKYNDFLEFINNLGVLQLDQKYKCFDDLPFALPFDLYYKTKFSLVSETHTFDDILFLTEKTYKTLSLGHPFMVFGSPGTLEYLRNQGYETFPELFDESYDTIANKKERLRKVIDNLKRDIEINQLIIEKLKHNQHVFFEQRSRITQRNILENFLLNE